MAKPGSPTWNSSGVGGDAATKGYWLVSPEDLARDDGTVTDISGNGYHGTFATLGAGAVAWGTGTYGPQLTFGARSFVDCGDFGTISGAEGLTLAVLVNLSSLVAFNGLICSRNAPGGGSDLFNGMHIDEAGTGLTFSWEGAALAATVNWTGGPAVPTGVWTVLMIAVGPTSARVAVKSAGGAYTAATTTATFGATTLGRLVLGADPINFLDRQINGPLAAGLAARRTYSDANLEALADDWLGDVWSAAQAGGSVVPLDHILLPSWRHPYPIVES